jgi:hypothetical protein
MYCHNNTKGAVVKYCDIYNKTLVPYCYNTKAAVVVSGVHNKILKNRRNTSDSIKGFRHHYSLVGC